MTDPATKAAKSVGNRLTTAEKRVIERAIQWSFARYHESEPYGAGIPDLCVSENALADALEQLVAERAPKRRKHDARRK